MLDYLKKFNNLPADLRQKVSSQTAMATIEALEKKYQILLAALVMRVMVKEVALKNLVSSLIKENLTEIAAGQLAKELKEKLFFSLDDYLSDGVPAPDVISSRVKIAAEQPLTEIQARPSLAASGALSVGDSIKFEEKPSGGPSDKGASFLFSSDDEAEIKELIKKIDKGEGKALPAAAVEEKLKIIIDQAQINFGSAGLAGRFKHILKTYLRGIRDKLDTKLALVKPFLSGGLSFDENSAQQIVDLADKVLNSQPGEAIKPFPKIIIPLPARDAPYDFSKLAKETEAASKITAAARAPDLELKSVSAQNQTSPSPAKQILPEKTDHELAPLTPTIVKPPVKKAMAPVPDKKTPPKIPEKKIRPAVQAPSEIDQIPLIRRRFESENLNISQKVKIEDVKYIPKVLSPLDEIKYMDLTSFRRLDKYPATAVEKIESKINLLAEENYGKRLEGIRLWRSSPINKLYLEIGHKSISENKPVDVIIEERKIKGGEYLTAAEFKVIMDLNKSLRF